MGLLLDLLIRPLRAVAVFSLCANVLLLAPALFMLQLFDRVLTSQSRETLGVLLLGVLVALGFMMVLDYLRSRLQGVLGSVLAERLSPAVARATLAQTAQGGHGTSGEGLRDVATLRHLFSAQGLLALFDSPWALLYIAVIWLAHPLLGIAAAGAALLMLVLALMNDRMTRRDIEAMQQDAAGATRYLEASMQNAEVVQQLGMAEALIGRWQRLHAKVTDRQRRASRKSVAMAAFTRASRQSVQVGIQALGAWLVITGEATPGILVATTILLARALSPIEQVVGSWRVLAEGRLAFRRLAETLATQAAQPARLSLPAPIGRLAAEGLAFRAPNSDRLVLAGVSLSLEPGQSLAIVGPSGAGKSTLARLLTGLWKPHAGVVRLDQADVAQWSRDELGPWLGYVPQDVELFAGSVAENIARLGHPDPARVVEAAQRAGVHQLVLSLPQGYDTVIDPLGASLSPGQRQRIALARALYGQPRLVVLDEPNSNLDGAGEEALASALKALKGKATVVVITHRSTLVQHMDKMLVLEAGRVQHYGSVEFVMQALQRSARAASGQVVPMRTAA